MILLLALAIVQADPPPDPHCPQGDLAIPRPPGSVCVGRLTEGYAFSMIWPREAATLPALDALLRQDAERSQRWIASETRRYRADRDGTEGTPLQLSYEAGWTVTAIVPQLAAASSAHSYYVGGAHGGIEFRVILLDRRRGRQIRLDDLFADPDAGLAAMQISFCRQLRSETLERRGADAEQPECPFAGEQPVSLVADATGRITAMRALLNPYVVGSWAEGPYEFDFPVTAAMLGVLKPEFRAAFAAGESGGS